jgi:hypothetical protein
MSLIPPPAGLREFPLTAATSGRGISVPYVVAAAGLLIIVSLAVVDAAWRGPWLDEFWTLELSDRSHGLLALIRDGWLRDAHPPVFNAWATLLGSLGLDSIPAGRLTSSLPAAGLMILAAWRFSRRAPGHTAYNTALLLLVLSLPQAMESFATYRAYFWHIASIGTLVLVARHVASAKADLEWRRDAELAAIAAVATAASIALHYVGGLFGGLLAAAIAFSSYRRGLWRWTVLILSAAAVASLLVVATILLQAPNWAVEFDHSWIDMPALEAAGIPLALAVTAICHNLIPFVGLWMPRHRESQLHFVAIIVSALVAGVAIILAVHLVRPIVVDRYLFAVPVLVCALMALPAARLAHNALLFGLLTLAAVAVAAVPLIRDGIKPLWQEDAGTIAKIVAACPSTQVYAASGWALGPAAETRTAHREDPVFARAYRMLAEDHGYAVRFIDLDAAAHATPGACPVLLWYEHTPNNAEDDLPAAIEEAGLTGLQKARLSVVRSTTGFIVRADPL